MKKTFVKPQVTTMPMQAETILAGSLTEGANQVVGGTITSSTGIAAKHSAEGFNWD